MATLSVVVITKNEEKNIREALASASFADEIVVLDSFSTDRTVKICRDFTDKVFQEEWRGFSAQKQRAVDLASNDWVFVLDADERMTPGLAEEIKRLVEAGPDKSGYYCPRRNYFMGREIRHGGWYPDYSIRFFNRRLGRFKDRAVHEAVELEGEAGYLKNPMLHFTYDSVSDFLHRMDKYSTLAAEELRKEGRRTNISDLLLRSHGTFVKMYLLKGGFRDGIHGLLLAGLYSYYTFAKYAKLMEMELREF
ncbi:MAG: glycosyltransferase family 2 protein [Nitrospirota bacterium]